MGARCSPEPRGEGQRGQGPSRRRTQRSSRSLDPPGPLGPPGAPSVSQRDKEVKTAQDRQQVCKPIGPATGVVGVAISEGAEDELQRQYSQLQDEFSQLEAECATLRTMVEERNTFIKTMKSEIYRKEYKNDTERVDLRGQLLQRDAMIKKLEVREEGGEVREEGRGGGKGRRWEEGRGGGKGRRWEEGRGGGGRR